MIHCEERLFAEETSKIFCFVFDAFAIGMRTTPFRMKMPGLNADKLLPAL